MEFVLYCFEGRRNYKVLRSNTPILIHVKIELLILLSKCMPSQVGFLNCSLRFRNVPFKLFVSGLNRIEQCFPQAHSLARLAQDPLKVGQYSIKRYIYIVGIHLRPFLCEGPYISPTAFSVFFSFIRSLLRFQLEDID